jgi:hypothetical protein
MKNKLICSLAVFTLGGIAQAVDNKALETSKTFLWIRSPFQTARPEKETMWRDRALAKACGWSGAFQAVPFGGQSTHAKRMAQYFMMCTKSELVVAENYAFGSGGLTADPNLRDVNANQFNISTIDNAFASTIKFRPRHTFYGIGLDYKQYLHRKDSCKKKCWAEISLPVLQVRNDLRLKEKVINQGTPLNAGADKVNADMKEAFKGQKGFYNVQAYVVTGSVWQYGKIDGAKKESGVADVEVKIGYDFMCGDCFHSEAYAGVIIPTGNSPKAEFVFEPILGQNKHWGFMWGSNWGWLIWEQCDRFLHLEMANNTRYFFERTEWRSFDIKGKPWSRYMLIYNSEADAASQTPTNGINVFTQKLKVDPRYMHDLNIALVFNWGNCQIEAGYNFWAKVAEHVKLDKPWQEGPAFVNLYFEQPLPSSNKINRAITIKENFFGSGQNYNENLIIKAQDLDLKSAASPAAITHTFYGTTGYRWDDWCYPVVVNVGGSYELSQVDSAPSRWTVWGKVGVSI